jgi:hypothetical protein
MIGGLGLLLVACDPAYVKQDNSDVLFKVVNITNTGGGPLPLLSDVVGNDGVTVTADNVLVLVAVREKNPGLQTLPQVPLAVLLDKYEVHFVRSDGRNIEGVDVPRSFVGALSGAVDAQLTTGQVPITVEVVRAQAKLEAPLSELRGQLVSSGAATTTPPPTDLQGRPLVVTMFAQVTIYGHTIKGNNVKDTSSAQIDFADFR